MADFDTDCSTGHSFGSRGFCCMCGADAPPIPSFLRRQSFDEDDVRRPAHVIAESLKAAYARIADLERQLAHEKAEAARLREVRNELATMLLCYAESVPLGHQPHMAAEKAEKLARAALAEGGENG